MSNFDLSCDKRIMILGNSASGKSTLAHQLSKKLNIPSYHLDKIFHLDNTNWQAREKEEFIKLHNEIIIKDNWIIEGNYSSTIDERLKRANKIIFISINRFTSLWNYFQRTFEPKRFGMPNCEDKFNSKMVKYILFQFPPKKRKHLDKLKNYNNVIYLNSFKELKKFKQKLDLEIDKKKILG